MNDHEVREFVNDLRDIALNYYHYQCLREKISSRVKRFISDNSLMQLTSLAQESGEYDGS